MGAVVRHVSRRVEQLNLIGAKDVQHALCGPIELDDESDVAVCFGEDADHGAGVLVVATSLADSFVKHLAGAVVELECVGFALHFSPRCGGWLRIEQGR